MTESLLLGEKLDMVKLESAEKDPSWIDICGFIVLVVLAALACYLSYLSCPQCDEEEMVCTLTEYVKVRTEPKDGETMSKNGKYYDKYWILSTSKTPDDRIYIDDSKK